MKNWKGAEGRERNIEAGNIHIARRKEWNRSRKKRRTRDKVMVSLLVS